MRSTPLWLAGAVAVLTAGMASVPASAHSISAPRAAVAATHSDVTTVAYSRASRSYGRRYYRSRPVVVDAPFAHVENRGWRSTSVDAPFTSVRVKRRGVWVRAPFVDLYVPR